MFPSFRGMETQHHFVSRAFARKRNIMSNNVSTQCVLVCQGLKGTINYIKLFQGTLSVFEFVQLKITPSSELCYFGEFTNKTETHIFIKFFLSRFLAALSARIPCTTRG